MPAKGKHRRPKSSSSLTRGFVAAGTGGAALALPLIGATGAHAAEKGAAPVALPQEAPKAQLPQQRTALPQQVAPAAPAAAPSAASAASAPKTDTRTYSVVSGDSLSKIAADQDVRGGWQKVYGDNKKVVGEDPSLIFPGMKLTLGGKTPAAAEQKASAPVPQQQRTERVERTEQRTEKRTENRVEQRSEKRTEQRTESKRQTQRSGFSAPVPSGVSTPYRASGGSWSSGYHTGVDFRASSGTPVKAVAAGTVVSAGWGGAYGNEVVIRHNDGRYSQYAHLSALGVRSGQSVSGGQQIGYSGSTGNSTGPHLHFEIRTGPGYGSDIDPLGYLRSNGVPL
ncbi:peptidase [Streptomyces spiroverticillatus]|uniref:Peptidase n=1 Tax=Streptomyces finlayi TaxID=67296 RepID=A0A919CAY2_9ACTN|nr:M23 family metallopeptidase [Streptomyces finlayi]GHA15030.1 peptidase [Streptomyces spiroverticillatus]GHC96928.1 peptidase [Streptomyces finlayi]